MSFTCSWRLDVILKFSFAGKSYVIVYVLSCVMRMRHRKKRVVSPQKPKLPASGGVYFRFE